MRRWLGALLLLPLLVHAAHAQRPATRVTGLRIVPEGGQTALLIQMDGEPASWTDFIADRPARLVIDIADARYDLPARFEGLDRGGIRGVRGSQWNPQTARIVVDLERAVGYSIASSPEGIRVDIDAGASGFDAWTSDRVAANPPAARGGFPQQEEPRITVTFQDTDIRDVLASFAEFTNRSIVPGEGVEGLVTASIRNQPWDIALATILRAYGLAAEEGPGGIIQVDKSERLQQRQTAAPLQTRSFRVNYIPAAELQATLEGLRTERGKITVNATTNTIVFTDVADVLETVERMIGELDIRTPQVSIQAKLIFVNRTDVEELGVTYDLKDSRGNSLNEVTSVPDPRNPGESTNQDLVLLGGNSVAALGNANIRVQGPQLETVMSLVLGRYTLVTFIDALQSAELSDVQAAPLITTLDNQEAEIWVGERTPIRVVDVGAGGGAAGGGGTNLPRATAELVETGIRLRVTPHITADRRILMELHAERSSALPAATDIGIIFQQQQARNRLMVADGETAVIGGLTVTEVTNTRAGIPFLMDLPLVGWLFRTDRAREQKRDLLIMVTPHIVDDRA